MIAARFGRSCDLYKEQAIAFAYLFARQDLLKVASLLGLRDLALEMSKGNPTELQVLCNFVIRSRDSEGIVCAGEEMR